MLFIPRLINLFLEKSGDREGKNYNTSRHNARFTLPIALSNSRYHFCTHSSLGTRETKFETHPKPFYSKKLIIDESHSYFKICVLMFQSNIGTDWHPANFQLARSGMKIVQV